MNIIPVKVINGNIHVSNLYLLDGRPKTYLNASADAAASTIGVFSIKGFSEGNYYAQIGEVSSGNSEIIKMHASTAPTGTTITLASALANDHDANEPVYFLNINQFEFSHSATTTGSKSTTGLGLKNIDPTRRWTICPDATNTTGYAFVRPYNVASTTYGDYSAAAPYANAAYNTVEHIIYEAMNETRQTENGRPLFTDDLTPDYLIKQVNECLRDIRRYKNKISWAQNYNYVLEQTAEGVFRYSLPNDIYDSYSTKAIEAVRLGGEPQLIKSDVNNFFDTLMEDVHFTQVRTAASAGDITLEIDNSYDFADSGSVSVGSQTITYTGVTRSATAGVLTGVPAAGEDGAITADIAVDDFVFQGESTGEPKYWTIFNGYLYIFPIPNSSWDNFNVNIDYFKTTTSIDSLDDAIDYIQYDMIKNWVKWRIRSLVRNSGVDDLQDSGYLLYREQLNLHIGKDRSINEKYFRNAYEFSSDDDMDINPREIRRG